MEQILIKDGINLYVIEDKKFKTYTSAVFIHQKLCRDTATKNALLPAVLKRGSANFKTQQEIYEKLEMLYGASLSQGVQKRGEDQILSFYLEGVSDAFIEDEEDCTKQALSVMFDVIFNPPLHFDEDAFAGEKNNLRDRIKNMVNDKRQYAVRRCGELSCENQSYAVCEYGYIDDLDAIRADELLAHYEHVINTSPIDIFVCGNVDAQKIKALICELLSSVPKRDAVRPDTAPMVKGELPLVTECMDVAQGKLSISFTTDTPASDKDYYALVVYNSIFGGGAHSKLFNNVREKLSLAYYASSQLDKLKGMITVSAGIEFSNFELALDEINAQKQAIENGEITQREFEAAIKSLVNGLRSYKDSNLQIIIFYLGQVLSGHIESPVQMAEKISAVTISDVVRVSKKIQTRLVYFLKGVGA